MSFDSFPSSCLDSSGVCQDGWRRKERVRERFLPSVMTYVIIYMTYVMFIYFSHKNTITSDDCLILPCEITIKTVVPAVKALMATELVEKRGLKQDEVAELLGISQSAVSKYTRKIRGYVIKIDEIEELEPIIEKMINLIVNGSYEREEFLKAFCQTCAIIRRTGIICQFCQKTDPNIKTKECNFCKAFPDLSEK